jgi:hypothetical protein
VKRLFLLLLLLSAIIVAYFLYFSSKGILPSVFSEAFLERISGSLSYITNNKQSKESVRFLSDVDGIEVGLVDEKPLRDLLEEFGFWREKNVALFGKSGRREKMVSPSFLVVHITDVLQPMGRVASLKGGKKWIYRAYGTGFDDSKKEFHLYLFMDPSILLEESEERLSKRTISLLVSSLYDVTHFVSGQVVMDERSKIKSQIVRELLEKELFLTVKKDK